MKLPYNIYKNSSNEYLVVFSLPNLDTNSVIIKVKWDTLTIKWTTFSVIDELIRKNEDPLSIIQWKLEVINEDLALQKIEFNETITFKTEISEEWAKAIFEKWFLIIRVKENSSKWFITLTVK